jgi:hypothetical protein
MTTFIITGIDVSFIQKKSQMLRRVSEFGSQKNHLFWPKIRFFELNYHFFEKKGIFEKYSYERRAIKFHTNQYMLKINPKW